MVDFDKIHVTVSPATKMTNDKAMQNFKTNKHLLDHHCHNQGVKHYVKLVTEASMHEAGFERRDG